MAAAPWVTSGLSSVVSENRRMLISCGLGKVKTSSTWQFAVAIRLEEKDPRRAATLP